MHAYYSAGLKVESGVIICRIRNDECISRFSGLNMRLFDLVQGYMLGMSVYNVLLCGIECSIGCDLV